MPRIKTKFWFDRSKNFTPIWLKLTVSTYSELLGDKFWRIFYSILYFKFIFNPIFQVYYKKELQGLEAKLSKKDFKDEEEEYRAKIIPQQIDETKAALKDTEQRLQKGFKKYCKSCW